MSIPILALRTGPAPKPTPSTGARFGDLPDEVKGIVLRHGLDAARIDPNSVFDLCKADLAMRNVCQEAHMDRFWEDALEARGWAMPFRYGLTRFDLYAMLHKFNEKTIKMQERAWLAGHPPPGATHARTLFLQQLVKFGNGVFGAPEEMTDSDDVQDSDDEPAVVRIDYGNFNARRQRDLPLRRLPDRITDIGSQAFDGCWHLALVALPADLRRVGGRAFYGCRDMPLNEGMGDALVRIGDRAFSRCVALNPPSLPYTLRSIGAGAFEGCTSLVLDGGIPEGVRSIGRHCFAGCTSLTLRGWDPELIVALGLGGSDVIGIGAFHGCTALTLAVRTTLQTAAPWVFHRGG